MCPLYDYRCDKCEETYEIFVPLAKLDEKIKCPECKRLLKREMPILKSYQVRVK